MMSRTELKNKHKPRLEDFINQKTPGRRLVANRVIAFELTAVFIIVLVIWLDEVLDIPHFLFGAGPTPINWRESIFECIVIAIVGAAICYFTNTLFKRMRYLEGLLLICASCKKVKDEKGNWQSIEKYIRDRSEAYFSHGICSECAKKIYPDLFTTEHETCVKIPDSL